MYHKVAASTTWQLHNGQLSTIKENNEIQREYNLKQKQKQKTNKQVKRLAMPSVSSCLCKKVGLGFQLWKKEAKVMTLENDFYVS